MEDKRLDVSQDEINWATELLSSHYREHPKFRENYPEKVDDILQKAINGWDTKACPKTFRTRIYVLSGVKKSGSKNMITSIQAKEKKLSDMYKDLMSETAKYQTSISKSVLDSLDTQDKKRFLELLKQYNNDYEFDTSSDQALLVQLISNQLLLARLVVKQFTVPSTSLTNDITKLTSSIMDLEDKLGITRKQRETAGKTIQGDVASISLELDKKLTRRKKQKDIQDSEVTYYKDLQKTRDPVYDGITVLNAINESDLKLVDRNYSEKRTDEN